MYSCFAETKICHSVIDYVIECEKCTAAAGR